jgi:hypothetical protein
MSDLDVTLPQAATRSRVMRRVYLVLTLVVAAFSGCADSCCNDGKLAKPDAGPQCQLDTQCKSDDVYRFGACQLGGCGADSDCCPGSRCRTDINTCFPYLLDNDSACTTDADCKDPAQRCKPTSIGGRAELPTCVYESCSGDVDCGLGRSCFKGECVAEAPCGGSCAAGTACDVVSGHCSPFPAGSHGCDASCPATAMLVFTDPASMSGETCCALECECKGLPPLVPTHWGRYAHVAVSTSEVLVSAYDEEYGDLVLAHYGLDGTFSKIDYVDGVPAGAAPHADPNGPRGGITDPGVNVGTHTSLALDVTGLARIAYQDVDNKSLKVALQTATGFTSHVVDAASTADANVGMFTDIAIGPTGTIFITYLAHNTNVPGQPGKSTALKLARSKTPLPASAADWDLFTIDARPIFDPCNGTCGAGSACVLENGAAACEALASSCSPACASSQSCVTHAGAPTCAPPAASPESPEVPRARGLFSSMVLDGGQPVVVYYDAIDGDLRAAKIGADGSATTVVVDGDGRNGHRTGDVGTFPTVTTVGTDAVVVYSDSTRHELRAWQGPLAGSIGVGGLFSVVDTGHVANQNGRSFVGAGASVVNTGPAALVVYQDASNLDLKIATQQGALWSAQNVLTTGPNGFYSDVAISGRKAYITSVVAELSPQGKENSHVGLTVQAVP